MDLGDVDLTDLDLFTGGFPDDVFVQLRHEAPVWWHEATAHTPDGTGFWVVSRHGDILDVTGDAETFSSERAPGAAAGGTIIEDLPYGFASGVLLNMMDDPRHHRIRRLVTPAVAPRALAALEPELRARTAAILDGVAAHGRCDFLVDVAVELPLQAIAMLMGVPEQDRHDLMAWTNATLTYDDRELGARSAGSEDAAAAMAAYGSALVARKRAEGGDDIVATVARATVDVDVDVDGSDDGIAGRGTRSAPLSDLELLMFFNLLIAAGSETTRNAIALGMAALIEHPDQWELLRSDPAALAPGVEEILRWSSPTLYNRRTATRDVEVAGRQVRAGDKVTLWWASANRDESVFDDPFRFDVRRTPNPHLAFGYRSHFCLGANLARLEIRIMLEELLARFDRLSLDGPVERFRTNKHAGVKHMDVVLHPRSPGPAPATTPTTPTTGTTSTTEGRRHGR
ncbi:MAG TPA: cytochrome P450 [Acidimicrobiales bacterium]|nr:cytochrome P450 [Acidimicrobiales bacterium]